MIASSFSSNSSTSGGGGGGGVPDDAQPSVDAARRMRLRDPPATKGQPAFRSWRKDQPHPPYPAHSGSRPPYPLALPATMCPSDADRALRIAESVGCVRVSRKQVLHMHRTLSPLLRLRGAGERWDEEMIVTRFRYRLFHNIFFYYQLPSAGTSYRKMILRKNLFQNFFYYYQLAGQGTWKNNCYQKVIPYQKQDCCTYNLVSKLFINDRFYKQYGALAFACSKLFINDRFYKPSGALAFACSKFFINDRFYKHLELIQML